MLCTVGVVSLYEMASCKYNDPGQASGPEALKVADSDGETPLHTAARGNHLEVVRWLLEWLRPCEAAGAALMRTWKQFVGACSPPGH
eukprot:1154870-Pelagomonas_calceolata.AAC.5